MSNDILLKANALKGAYPGSPTWKSKVDKMSDNQIVAVYLRLKRENKV
ncbi:gp068 [Rhodococcus phage ReqiPepy6]|uniref:Gp068 n=1 Tax=Rhodococcus phage ReqiPepy6 TaxID=691965 RepID=D4P7H9_9CAUD|nr:gp068 [Rhodococcus phage ReqiPepy6]ADD80959.1 gp068 [Rhodococcus phage ReqiPepy6]